MAEYIVDFRGIGITLVFLAKTKPPFLWSKGIRALHRKERIVRCKDCKHFAHAGAKNLGTNETTHDACHLLSTWDSEYDFTEWWYTNPDGFCVWGERRRDG